MQESGKSMLHLQSGEHADVQSLQNILCFSRKCTSFFTVFTMLYLEKCEINVKTPVVHYFYLLLSTVAIKLHHISIIPF